MTTVQDALTGYPTGLSSITVEAVSGDALDAAQAEVTAILTERKDVGDPTNPGFQVINQGAVREASDASTDVFTTLLGAVAAISLLVAAAKTAGSGRPRAGASAAASARPGHSAGDIWRCSRAGRRFRPGGASGNAPHR